MVADPHPDFRWARSLGKLADPPPASLVQYVECHMEFGGTAASAQLCTYDIVIPPLPVRHIISGSREQALVPRDEDVSTFLASLFDRVRERGSEVQLASWDLYHGHAFLYVEPGADATVITRTPSTDLCDGPPTDSVFSAQGGEG